MPRAGRHPHPLELALERAPAGRLLLLLDREPRLLLLEPRRVVALERDAVAAVELEDPAGHVVEEVAVVRDGEHGAGVVVQEPLEPGHRLGVEVVGRLVEQQQVGRRQQQAAQRDPAPLAAREVGHLGVGGRQPQRVHGDVQHPVEAPGVGAVDAVLHLALLVEQRLHLVVGHRLGEAGGDLVVAVEQRPLLGDAVLDVAAHVLGLVELGLLGQVPDGRAGRDPGLAVRGLVQAGHDPKQRGLAGAVRAEHADLRAGQERERDLAQHLPLGAEELVRPVHGVDVRLAHARQGICAKRGLTPFGAVSGGGSPRPGPEGRPR